MRDKIINTQGINELKHELLWTLESIKKKKTGGNVCKLLAVSITHPTERKNNFIFNPQGN